MTEEAKRIVTELREGVCCHGCAKIMPTWDNPYPCSKQERMSDNNDKAADLIESLSGKVEHLEYTLVGIMHFVEKWLDDVEPYSLIDDPDGQIAIERAAEARRITLDCIEKLQKQLEQVTRERDAAVEDIKEAAKTGCLCYVCKSNNEGHCGAFDRRIFESVVMCGQYKWRGVEVEGWLRFPLTSILKDSRNPCAMALMARSKRA